MPQFQDITYPSSTGHNTIHALLCRPDGPPRAIIQIVHGIAEHVNRYRDFMEFLAGSGFVVCAEDHLGHGGSIRLSYETGFFAENNGWNYVLQDMGHLQDILREEYPELPYIFFGHSMGSFLTRHYLILHPDSYSAAILSGTGHQSKGLALAGYSMASAAVRLYGPRKYGRKLNDIAFGSYNKGFEHPRTAFDWLSRDTEAVDRYIADPRCGFIATVSLFRDMMGGILFITDQKNIAKMNQDRPIYFMSGAEDPVGENGKGVNRAYEAFCNAGIRDVFMRLYPRGRHEMLNELNKADVYQDILNWLNEKL